MRRIDSPNRAVDLFGAGKDGFKAAVSGVAPATELTPDWFNAVQEAIVRTIEAAGLGPSAADLDQFTTAITSMISQNTGDKVTYADLDAKVAALVGSAPDLLDTLKELADAIGDDPNFSVTMANQLAGKERKFDSGTCMLFQQTVAPVGWTKVTTHNDKALRVVSGAVSSGGTQSFSEVFTAAHTDSTALPAGEYAIPDGGTSRYDLLTTDGSLTSLHNHSINLSVQYVDVIIASKD